MRVIGKCADRPAYIIEDGETRYPVFEESLHAVEIFDSLISSGYKFCGIPYDFRKDGVSITSLPVVNMDITVDLEQDMFDMNDLPRYDASELRQKISQEDVTYIPEAPADYKIATREEFISYLKDIKTAQNPDDFKPINYFVSPAARFTMDEWLSGEYAEYFRIMEGRRRLTYDKFLKLRSWLVTKGMSALGNSIDFMEAYCQWGIDGLSTRFVSKQRKTQYIYEDFKMTADMAADSFEITRNDLALVDRYGAVFPPEDIPAGYDGWKVSYNRGKESPAFRQLISTLKEGEYGVVAITTKGEEERLELSTTKETISISPYKAKCGQATMYMFTVTTPDVTAHPLPDMFWSAKYDQRVLEMTDLRAIAYEMVFKRKFVGDVSSYKLMTDIGCDVKGALRYILNKNLRAQAEEEKAAEEDPSVEANPVSDDDIDLYVSGNYEMEELDDRQTKAFEIIKDVIEGRENTGYIESGAQADRRINPNEIYKYLYCAHFCKLQLPVSDIYKAIDGDLDSKVIRHTDATGYEDDVVALTADGFTLNVPCPEIKKKIDGYKADMNAVKIKQAEQCCGFLKVEQIASEYGNDSKRHVAFEASTVNLLDNGKAATGYLDKIMEMFEERLQERVPLSMQPTLRLYKRVMCMAEYFRIAEFGEMKFPAELGGDTITLPIDFVIKIGNTVKTKITSTAVYCEKMVDDMGMLTHYCVNADITPWKIYPRKGIEIPCATLPALWYNWQAMGMSQILDKLQTQRFVPFNFVPWTNRYLEQSYFKNLRSLPSVCDLTNYMSYCDQFRSETKANEDFINAPHLETLLYGMYPDETVRQEHDVDIREEGKVPSLTVSTGSIVVQDPEHGKIVKKHETKPNLRVFKGFEAEDYAMLGDVTKVKLPGVTEKYIVVNGDTISTYDRDDLPAYMVSQLVGVGYPVINLYGRKYIFRDINGVLWEVII